MITVHARALLLAAALLAVITPGCREPVTSEPSTVSGPVESYVNAICAFTAGPEDSLGGPVRIRFDWGDGDTSAWGDELVAGQTDTAYHYWTALGTYLVSSQSMSEEGVPSDWTTPCTLVIVNRAPPAPRILEAEDTGAADTGLTDTSYPYDIAANDPDGESLSYRMTWAEGETTAWTAPTPPSTWQTFRHAWTDYGTFVVRAQARDPHGALSEWSPAVNVTIFLPPPALKWKYSNGFSIEALPAVGADGAVYFASGGRSLHCLNPDGTVRWSYHSIGYHDDAPPVIGADGTIYTALGGLEAIWPDGTLRWHAYARKTITYSPAVAADGTIIITYNNDSLLALGVAGDTAWQCSTRTNCKYSPSIGPNGAVYAEVVGDDIVAVEPGSGLRWRTEDCAEFSPAVGADGTIYAATSIWLYALSPDGSILWQCPIAECSRAEPVIGPDGTIYVGGKGSQLFACTAAGTQQWSLEFVVNIRSEAPALLADGTLLVTTGSYLWAVNAADGRAKWRFRVDTNDPTAPNVGPDGTIYVGTARGDLYAIHGTSPLADSPWPKYRHDAQNTGRAGGH